MKWIKTVKVFLMCILILGMSPVSLAEEAPSVPESKPPRVNKKSKGRNLREKEAEGTRAPKRFDTDIIIKSKYELNGQSLEVDTD